MPYQINKVTKPVVIDGRWDKEPWSGIKPLIIENYMGAEPEHKPGTLAKLVYDDSALYVIFHVEDRYVRAVAPEHLATVYEDSCVEFFLTPGNDIIKGYINVEINCGGTVGMYYQLEVGKGRMPFTEGDIEKLTVAHSMPKIVNPEIAKTTVWTIEYRLPYEVLAKYCKATKPGPGVRWKGNFYKCADATSHPHWLTWSPIDFPKPKFHMPEYFGKLVFK